MLLDVHFMITFPLQPSHSPKRCTPHCKSAWRSLHAGTGLGLLACLLIHGLLPACLVGSKTGSHKEVVAKAIQEVPYGNLHDFDVPLLCCCCGCCCCRGIRGRAGRSGFSRSRRRRFVRQGSGEVEGHNGALRTAADGAGEVQVSGSQPAWARGERGRGDPAVDGVGWAV